MGHQLSIALVALLMSSVSHAADTEQQVLKGTVSTAISEYKRSGDASVVLRALPNVRALSGADRYALVSVSSELLNVLYETADTDFDATKKPRTNSQSPGGWYSSGTDPENIKDPKLRAEYQKVREQDRKYAEYYRQQAKIFDAIDQLANLLRQNFRETEPNEILDSLVKNGLNPSYGSDFLRRIEAQGA